MSAFFQVNHKLIGEEKQQKIASSHVAIVGVGGLGCTVAMGLVRLGVKTLTLIDSDTIEPSNVPRQLLFNHNDVDQPKVRVAKQRLSLIFEDIDIHVHEDFIDNKNGLDYLKTSDLVIDCTDNYLARYTISKSCKTLNIPMIYGGVNKFEGQIGVFNFNSNRAFHDIFPNITELIKHEDCSSSGVLPFVVQHIGNLQVV
ncbi:MAG: HesA/MoeB/ThiF family protein, partial [Bacteroidota bacterium]